MLIEQALFFILSNASAITSIVSTRIYPVTMPQVEEGKTSYPALVYELVGRDREQTHEGPTKIVRSHFTLHSIGREYLQVKQLADAVRLAVNGKSAEFAAAYGDHVRGVFLRDESDDYLFDEVEKLSLYHVPQSLVIQHWEALA